MLKRQGTLSRSLSLVLADSVCFSIAILLALLTSTVVRYFLIGEIRLPVASDAIRIFLVFGTAYVILLFRSWSLGHYSQFRPFWLELQELTKTVLIIAAFDAFLLFAIGVQFSRLWFGFFLVFLYLLIPYGREKTRMLLIKKGLWFQPTFIVGSGGNAQRTADALESDTSLGHEVLGFISLDKSLSNESDINGKPVFTNVEQARRIYDGSAALVFALETAADMSAHQNLINDTIASSEQVTIVPPDMELPLYGASVVGIFRHDTVLLKLHNRLADAKAQRVKRMVDIVFSIVFLILFSPVFLCLGMMICRDGGPLFYRHRRIGKNAKPFDCLKFRSMAVDSDRLLEQYLAANPSAQYEWQNKRKLINDPRVTPIGHYLRRTSIDELPQLFNVIKGEMSLVGPRPIVEDEQQYYDSSLSYYLTMKPGMTGLWQVSGRTDTTYNERVRLDVWYCRNWKLWNDVVILIKTCKTLIYRHGAY